MQIWRHNFMSDFEALLVNEMLAASTSFYKSMLKAVLKQSYLRACYIEYLEKKFKAKLESQKCS